MANGSRRTRPREVSAMFGRIAGRYDLGNRVLSLGRDQSWRRRAVRLLAPRPGDTVLDLGAGTADLSIELARCGARVVGVDFTSPMLALGREKVRRAGTAERVHLVAGDALRLPFADGVFDGAAAAFTIRNLASLVDGLREIWRVLRPGGRLACLEFSRPRSRVVNTVYQPYLRYLLPLIGGGVTGDGAAYRYLADSITAFPTAASLAAVMREAGFDRVVWHDLSLGVCAVHIAERSPAASPTP